MPVFLSILGLLVVAYFLLFPYRFVHNIINARKTGLPSIIVPWDPGHIVWSIISVPLRPVLQEYLPKWIYNRLVITIYGWEFHERLRPFKEYVGNAKSYMLVNCGKNEFWTRDPEIAAQILNRPQDFQQLDVIALFMGRFGHNVLTTNGDVWLRQRKIVASVINERISKAVFNESIRQTHGLIDEVFSSSTKREEKTVETDRMFDMIKKIAIHVLSGAGLGASVSWDSTEHETPEPGSDFKMTYMEAVKVVIKNVAGPMALPRWFLLNYPSFLPGHRNLKALGYAVEQFPRHTRTALQQERHRMSAQEGKESETKNNFLSQLVRANENEQASKSLSEEEMVGNMFIFTGAGFDTTANTISYAVALLARYPEWQDWVIEEIDRIIPAETTDEEMEYQALFPKATRTMALMMETLRLFSPLNHVAKMTKSEQTIQTSKVSYWIPRKTTCKVDIVAVHLDPDIWRNVNVTSSEEESEDDEERFRPSRWINPPGSSQTLFQPPRGTFLPWSAGPRVCPGQKMAQVEFTAVMMTLLRRLRVEAVELDGENRQQVEARLDKRMRDSVSMLTLQMNGVYDVGESESEGKGLKLRLRMRK